MVMVLAACGDTGEPATPTSLSASSPAASPTPGPSSSSALPTSAADTNTWLHTKAYLSWAKESAPHPSEGPHASSVLTYVNPALEASLKSGAVEHPEGAAAVKEFIGADGVTGWAVAVKTSATSDSGQGWYWYETFSATPGRHGIEGQGKSLCVNCHASGSDYVLTHFPLR